MLKKLFKMMKDKGIKVPEDKPIDIKLPLPLSNNYDKGFDSKYKALFDSFDNTNDILDCYISNTIQDQLFEDSKLNYLIKYIDSIDSPKLEIDFQELVVLLENRVIISNTKKFYNEIFENKTDYDEILQTYIVKTTSENLYNDLQIECLSEYLVTNGFWKERLENNKLRSILEELVVLLENRVIISNTRKFYNEIFENKTDYEKILQTYIAKTTSENLYKDLQIECLSEYLVTNGFWKERLENNKLRSILEEKIELNKLKKHYNKIFKSKTTVNEILITYIEDTSEDELYNAYRIEYLTTHLKSILAEKTIEWDSILTRYSVYYCKNPELSITEIQFCDELTNDPIFRSLSELLDDEVKSWEHKNQEIIDSLIYSIVFKYGIDAIELDVYNAIIINKSRELAIDAGAKTLKDFKERSKSRTLYFGCEIKSDDLSGKGFCLLVGNRTVIFLPLTGGLSTTYRPDIPRDFEINPISRSENYIFKFEDASITITEDDKKQLISFFNFINKEITSNNEEIISKIIKKIDTASYDLIELTHKFLDIIPNRIFLSCDDYVAFEYLSFTGQLILYANSNIICSGEMEFSRTFSVIQEDSDAYEPIQIFINSTFNKFLKVAGKYIDIEEKFHHVILWALIRKSSIKFFSNYWNEKYSIYFEDNISITSLDEWIDLYCRRLGKKSTSIDSSGSFTYFLMDNDIFPADIKTNFVKCNLLLVNKIFEKNDELELEAFESSLIPSIPSMPKNNKKYSISDIDLMNGHEFERFISKMFEGLGYITEITRGSGDQGMDVIAEKQGTRIGIQAKCYSGKVTNKAVQEISAALNHYDCEKGIVVTNNYFTSSAIELASSNNIVLWDRDVIKMKIEELQLNI